VTRRARAPGTGPGTPCGQAGTFSLMSFKTDDELMALVRAGDSRAFADLYERHRVAVFTYLVRLGNDHHGAEDLLQETFLRAYRARDSYQPSTQFRAWILTIARRQVIDRWRRQRLDWDTEPHALETVSTPRTADHLAEARERLARVEEALQHLAPSQRELILLSRVAGMDALEIASITGSTPGAVRVALHRALRRLRSLLQANT
jgi:RNA polymerase sigma factor (sigma-70 family)